MADANTALIVLASVQGALTLVLAGATGFYAWRTQHISQATREQAEASVEMAREMREQRLAEDLPYLLLDVVAQEGSKDHHAPKAITVRLHNAGPAPAKDISVTVIHPEVVFFHDEKGYLLKGDSWETVLQLYIVQEMPHVAKSVEEWASKRGVVLPEFVETGVVAQYVDMHDRPVLSCLELNVGYYPADIGGGQYKGEFGYHVDPSKQWVKRVSS